MEFTAKLGFVEKHAIAKRDAGANPSGLLKNARNAFTKALGDDFNTPKALAAIFQIVATLQPKLWNLTKSHAKEVRRFLTQELGGLGFRVEVPNIPQKITTLVKEREKCRKNKQFTHSDALRKEIAALGYVVEDTPVGPFVWPR